MNAFSTINFEPTEQKNETSRILSIQSHVVHGYVGNKAAVFPLQLLGFDVDVINSVHFSNHTGHTKGFRGDVLNGDQLLSILNGLESNDLLANIGYLLTGYIGSESFLRAVLIVVQKLRRNTQEVRYVCDPVLGDHGHLYVPEALISIYKNEVIPLANIVTPNQFEAETLTSIKINDLRDAKNACAALHNLGPEMVFITSMTLQETNRESGGGEKAGEGSIAILASRRSSSSLKDEVWRIDSPIIPGRFTGTGDLCAALLLAWTTKHPDNLGLALEKVTGTMYAIIKRTFNGMKESVVSKELKLIQSKVDIEAPKCLFTAQRLS